MERVCMSTGNDTSFIRVGTNLRKSASFMGMTLWYSEIWIYICRSLKTVPYSLTFFVLKTREQQGKQVNKFCSLFFLLKNIYNNRTEWFKWIMEGEGISNNRFNYGIVVIFISIYYASLHAVLGGYNMYLCI